MKNQLNNGEKRIEKFYDAIEGKQKVEYQYRHFDGTLFYCTGSSVFECQQLAKEKFSNVDDGYWAE